jgi:hypothetical protein
MPQRILALNEVSLPVLLEKSNKHQNKGNKNLINDDILK